MVWIEEFVGRCSIGGHASEWIYYTDVSKECGMKASGWSATILVAVLVLCASYFIDGTLDVFESPHRTLFVVVVFIAAFAERLLRRVAASRESS